MAEKNSVLEQQGQLVDEALEMRLLTPKNAEFISTPGGFVTLKYHGKEYQRVLFFRCFPFSAPGEYISVRTEEDNNKEIGIIVTIHDFDKQTKTIVEEQLALRYFIPQIQTIYEIKEQHGYSYWHVNTNKGECRFTVDQNGVSKLSENHLLVSDVDGNRFELCDVTSLSAKELRMVDLYM